MKPGRLNVEPSLKEPAREPKDSFPREPWSVSQLKAEESCVTEILGCNNNSIQSEVPRELKCISTLYVASYILSQGKL